MLGEQGTNLVGYQNIIKHHFIVTFIRPVSSIWFCPKTLGYLVYNSWSTKQCQLCVLTHGMSLK